MVTQQRRNSISNPNGESTDVILVLPHIDVVTITADIASSAPVANSEGGQFDLLFDGVVVASHDFGAMTAGETKHAADEEFINSHHQRISD